MSSQRHFGSNATGRRDGGSLLHQQLKRETAGLHKRLEAQLGLFEPGFSIHLADCAKTVKAVPEGTT